MFSLSINDNIFSLHAGKAVYWPSEKTLFVADTHFSKDAVFRSQGIALPSGNNLSDLNRLSEIVLELDVDRLLVLGDFTHGKMSNRDPFIDEFATWRNSYSQLSFEVVAGNHDRHLDKSLIDGIIWHKTLYEQGFHFVHEPEEAEKHSFFFAGHIHPAYTLRVDRSDTLRMPVFWQSPIGLVLPSFGGFTGGYNIKPSARDRLFGSLGKDVLQIYGDVV